MLLDIVERTEQLPPSKHFTDEQTEVHITLIYNS